MELYEAIEQRRTTRDFENEPISHETIVKMIGAAFKAPTNDHMRDWHYIVIEDKKTVNRLLELVPKEISKEDMDQLIRDWNLSDARQQECYRNAVPKQYRMLLDAAVVVIPLFKQKTNVLKPENLSHLNGFASIWCSIENLFLAATAQGYGCSLRIPLGEEGAWARQVLQFPEDYLMPCFIGIGRPKKGTGAITQTSINLDERIHWNQW